MKIAVVVTDGYKNVFSGVEIIERRVLSKQINILQSTWLTFLLPRFYFILYRVVEGGIIRAQTYGTSTLKFNFPEKRKNGKFTNTHRNVISVQ